MITKEPPGMASVNGWKPPRAFLLWRPALRGMRSGLVVSLVACGGSEETQAVRGTGGEPVAAVEGAASQPSGGDDAGQIRQARSAPLDFRDEDFVEGERNRDPFRSFARMFEVKPVDRPQVEAIMPTTSVDEMRLTAIVSGVASPRAMFVDSVGVGYVVRRGDFLGRPEVVQTGGAESVAVPLHWKVERIRQNEVVLSRDDTSGPNRPPVTRVLQLHEG